MALKAAEKTAGDYLDLKALVHESGPVVCIFRIQEFLPSEPGSFNPLTPVIADVLICDGPRKGEVHLGERHIGGITSTLRGVKNPKKGEAVPEPVNAVGDEIVTRVKLLNEGKANEGAVGDPPSSAEMAAAAEVYGDGSIWDAEQPTGAKVPAQAGASTRPF